MDRDEKWDWPHKNENGHTSNLLKSNNGETQAHTFSVNWVVNRF